MYLVHAVVDDKNLEMHVYLQFYIHSSLDLTNLNLMKYQDWVNQILAPLNYFTIVNSIWFSELHDLVTKSGLTGSFVKSRLLCIWEWTNGITIARCMSLVIFVIQYNPLKINEPESWLSNNASNFTEKMYHNKSPNL